MWKFRQYEIEKLTNLLSPRPIIPPFKSVILRNTNLARELMFYDSSKTPIDELYNENSKYSKSTIDLKAIELTLSKLNQIRFQCGLIPKDEFIIKDERIFKPLESIPEHLRKCLNKIQEETPIFIGTFLLIRSDRDSYNLFKFDRSSNCVVLIKELNSEDIFKFIEENVFINQQRYEYPQAILFIYGNHVISRIIYGTRGYRVILLECGRVVESIKHILDSNGKYSAQYTYIFYDDPINEFLNLNNQECAVHAIIIIGGDKQ